MENQIKSASVKLRPQDHRCKYWAKVFRAHSPLPMPLNVIGAADLAVPYSRQGEEEIFVNDILIEGEANHHRKLRGWTYRITFINPIDGEKACFSPSAEIKQELKSKGLPAELLAGSGDLAACVRIAHAVRSGLFFI